MNVNFLDSKSIIIEVLPGLLELIKMPLAFKVHCQLSSEFKGMKNCFDFFIFYMFCRVNGRNACSQDSTRPC